MYLCHRMYRVCLSCIVCLYHASACILCLCHVSCACLWRLCEMCMYRGSLSCVCMYLVSLSCMYRASLSSIGRTFMHKQYPITCARCECPGEGFPWTCSRDFFDFRVFPLGHGQFECKGFTAWALLQGLQGIGVEGERQG